MYIAPRLRHRPTASLVRRVSWVWISSQMGRAERIQSESISIVLWVYDRFMMTVLVRQRS